ncbi:MAG: hypothetical protein AMXMBFR84_02550 [Candidatus Hydrogenedentota bacterium]
MLFRVVCWVCLWSVCSAYGQERVVTGNGFLLKLDPGEGAPAHELTFNGKNWAAGLGVAWEGFGVGSYYVPNRHLNETVKTAGSGLAYDYDCDGPNITGLHATRTLEPVTDSTALKVGWRVEHKGKEDQWVAPWVRHDVAPGGALDDKDRVDVPSVHGIVRATFSGYQVASRNWIAATDPSTKESLCAIYNAEQTHAFVTHIAPKQPYAGLQTAFLPFLMRPGDSWETSYILTMVRGLTHVDFASEELAVQLDYATGELRVAIAGAKSISGLSLHASIMEPNGKVNRLPAQDFDLVAGGVTTFNYPWAAPADGAYDFLALVKRDETNVDLGRTVHTPHGGIDAQFIVGKPRDASMEPWTDAAVALRRRPLQIKRDMAVDNAAAVWIEPALEKVFAEDIPVASGTIRDGVRLILARNEAESFQLVVRPPDDSLLSVQSVRVLPMKHVSAQAEIRPDSISVFNVLYTPVAVPSYYEGPSGEWPDALLPFQPFDMSGGRNQPIWVTVRIPENTPAGKYIGGIELATDATGAIPIRVEVEVLDFALPATPALKSDFGLDISEALALMKRFGFKGSADSLREQYLALGAESRITLRDTAQLPKESPDYGAALATFERGLDTLRAHHATTHSASQSLLEFPDQLKLANAAVVRSNLQESAFTLVASEPKPATWPRVFERIQQWRDIAPDIPVMVATMGLEPFLSDAADIWAVHVPVFDTPNNRVVLDRIKSGGEVWWYVNHAPPRPYGNFFLDFAALEHRILFWQAWVLGVKGFHYWNVSYTPPQDDPYKGLLDITPVNGDGFLLYPSAEGPVRSIRWETIRDGVEDYDYLVMFRERMEALEKKGGHASLLARVQQGYNMHSLVPSLVSFSRDFAVLQSKRSELGSLIVEMDKALAN